MTPEQQRIAIAEACGWWYGKSTESGGIDEWHRPDKTIAFDIPNYPNDLNAMHEAEKIILKTQWNMYVYILSKIVEEDRHSTAIHSTSQQRAEAFLRTIGKWV